MGFNSLFKGLSSSLFSFLYFPVTQIYTLFEVHFSFFAYCSSIFRMSLHANQLWFGKYTENRRLVHKEKYLAASGVKYLNAAESSPCVQECSFLSSDTCLQSTSHPIPSRFLLILSFNLRLHSDLLRTDFRIYEVLLSASNVHRMQPPLSFSSIFGVNYKP
jgi:hypothetical protein